MAWWDDYRSQFPVTGLCTYMDSAYDCGGSLIGRAAAGRYFDDWAPAAAAALRGGPGREPFFKMADEARTYIGRVLGGVPSRNVTITKNTNEGFNIIMQGFDFKPGDNIVTFDWEHSAILVPCLHAARTRGVEVRMAKMLPDRIPSMDALWEQVDAHTVMICVSYVQSLTGYKMDLAELGRKCREKGIFLVVDGIQGVGLSVFEAEKWGVSAVSGGAYKGLCAFISIGYLYICDALLQRVRPVFAACTEQIELVRQGELPEIRYKDEMDARKYDNCSSDLLGTYVLHDSVQKILEIGTDRIQERITGLLTRLYKGLALYGYRMVTPADSSRRCASLCFKSEHADEIYEYFIGQKVILSSGSGYIRMSLGAYTSDEDIERTLEVAGKCPWR